MQIFLDSANILEIEEINSFGIMAGLTTNPTLLSKTITDFESSIAEICKIVKGDVSIEVVADDSISMIKQGEKLLKFGDNVVIKLPLTWEGIKACKHFSENKVKVNMTLCFSSNQALLAGLAGAAYISPFVGRLEDSGADGLKLIEDIRQIFDNNPNIHTKILAASIRNPYHVQQCALAGADIATMSGKIIKQLISHPLTSSGLESFNQDWQKSKLQI
jgi:transaldolase